MVKGQARDGQQQSEGSTTIFLLVLWELWKHRNAIVFEGASLSIMGTIGRVMTEGRLWLQAGKFKGNVDPFFLRLEWWARNE